MNAWKEYDNENQLLIIGGGDEKEKYENTIRQADNLYDKNAVQVYDQREKLIGYVPRYYAETFAAFIKEKRVKKGKILCVDKNRNCDECIKIEVSVAGV